MCLEALQNLLEQGKKDTAEGEQNAVCDVIEECQGIDAIETLQEHGNNDVYTRALNLIKNYFEVEGDAEDATLAPTVDQSGNFFAFGGQASGGAPVPTQPSQPFEFGSAKFVF